MRINLTSVLVDDQEKALRFYTEVLGFTQKVDVSLGEHRWITVVSPEDPHGTELVLEPDQHPAAKPFKEALVADGVPFTSFVVDDVRAEYERLRRRGVRFTQAPTEMGPVTTAVLFIDEAHEARLVPSIGRSINICESCKETPQSDHSCSLPRRVSHIIGCTHGKRRSMRMRLTQPATCEGSRPDRWRAA